MKHHLLRVGPLSAAKVVGAIYFALGLLFMPLFVAMGFGHGGVAWSDLAFALAAPVAYGLMGGLAGGFGALIYNRVARWIGGLELTLLPHDAGHNETEHAP